MVKNKLFNCIWDYFYCIHEPYTSSLQRSFQELKLRYEEKERNLAPNTSVQGSSQPGRSDLEMGLSQAEKDKFLSQKVLVIV